MQETQEMQVWTLGWKDPLEEEMAVHSSILAWRISDWGACIHGVTQLAVIEQLSRSSAVSFSFKNYITGVCCCCCCVASVVWSHRQQPTSLPRPWDSPGKNTGVGCHFLLQCMKGKSEREVAQSCLTLSHPVDCSLPGSSVHGIFQARVLKSGAIAFSIRVYGQMI